MVGLTLLEEDTELHLHKITHIEECLVVQVICLLSHETPAPVATLWGGARVDIGWEGPIVVRHVGHLLFERQLFKATGCLL